MKQKLKNVTLLGIDCVNVERLQVAMNICERDVKFGAVKLLTSLSTNDERLVEIPHLGSIEAYSRFCIEELVNYVDTDFVLLVQYDGFILNPQKWTDDFLHYDYIGAPLSWGTKEPNKEYSVGNGGFSLRSKKFLEASAHFVQEGKIIRFNPEDASLCVWHRDLFENEGMVYAPVTIGKKFSVVEDFGEYENPFGFHGFFDKNISSIQEKFPEFPLHMYLPRIKKKRLEKIQQVFSEVALEGHVLGSLARGEADMLSDIDVWLTYKDEDMEEVLEKRFESFNKIGNIIHACEPPQNSPECGVQSFVLYKTKVGLFAVDYYLSPLSTSFVTKESKKLFGEVMLPVKELVLNTQKIDIPQTYRIDFFITFVFNAIKKIVRKYNNPLETLFLEYENLSKKYGIHVADVENKSNPFETVKAVIANIEGYATETQKKALSEISFFIESIQKNEEFYFRLVGKSV